MKANLFLFIIAAILFGIWAAMGLSMALTYRFVDRYHSQYEYIQMPDGSYHMTNWKEGSMFSR